MTARAFLIRGLLAGLLAGLATFFVAYQVGEPHVETAIALEEADAAADEPATGQAHSHDEAQAPHSHGDEGAVVSRGTQRTWGLLTGTLAVAVVLGGVIALVAAGAAGRLGPMPARQSTALVSAIGFTSFALVPFLKYPATPPAVGSGDTIGARTGLYFGFMLVSVAAAVVVTVLAVRLRPRVGTYAATVGGIASYLLVVAVAGRLFSTVDEVGDFPAGTLWSFRLASIATLAAMWLVIGVVLTGLIGRLHRQVDAAAARRQLAVSI